MTEVAGADAAQVEGAGADTGWQRLDGRMLVVAPVANIVRLLPVILVALFTGRGDPIRIWITVGIAGLLVIMGVVRWRTTKYRITDDRVELHSGWLRRQRRSVPRDRLRTVDLTSTLLHRVFKLSVVHVRGATGSSADHDGLKLDAVSTAEAERLRRVLLAGRIAPARAGGRTVAGSPTASGPAPATLTPDSGPPGPAAPGPAPAGEAAPGKAIATEVDAEEIPSEEIARLHWSWIRFAPLTVSSLAGTGAVVAAVWNVFGDLGVDPWDVPVLDQAADRVFHAAVWVTVGVIGALLLVIAVVGALLLFAERWWGYRLGREPDGTLRVARGLLTRRSLSVSGQRLRGVAVSETLLLRAGRAAQVRALAAGFGRDTQGGALEPPAPRAEAHRVASAALREPPEMITGAPLARHPRRARTRRLTRALGPAAVLVVLAWVVADLLPSWSWLVPVSIALLVLTVPLALDRYRNLGHALTARYLVTRHGSLNRRTVALARTGVIGWTFRQSIFQRRAGLVTLQAVTAAGEGGYLVLDVDVARAVALADATTPGVLADLRLPD